MVCAPKVSDQGDSEALSDVTPCFQTLTAFPCIPEVLDIDLSAFCAAFLIFN